jgi:hypothetical protein
VGARARAVGVAIALLALCAATAAQAAPAVPHLLQLRTLYAKDHPGGAPAGEAELLGYSKAFERVLGSCTIKPGDLADATLFWSGKISALGGPRTSSLAILQAFGKGITWNAPRDCWNMFIAVEGRMENSAAASQMKFRHEITALYVYDHQGASPKSSVQLLPYSTAFVKIIDHCIVSAEENTNLMIHLSDQASEVGGRNVTTLKMLQAIARRIDWSGPKIICWDVFDNAEGHAEAGQP